MAFHEEKERSSSRAPRRKAHTRRSDVTEERARAQRAKLDAQAEERQQQTDREVAVQQSQGKATQRGIQARRRAATTLARAIDDYLQDHDGGNHSEKTLEWHRTALGLLRRFLEEQREITLIGEVDASDISGERRTEVDLCLEYHRSKTCSSFLGA